MNKNLRAMVSTVMGLVFCTALVLANRDSFQKLGEPGVKVIPVPSYDTNGHVVNTQSVYLPENLLHYASTNVPISGVVLGWLPGDTTYGQRVYFATNGSWMQMNVVLMGTDRTSIHKPDYCLTGVGWDIVSIEHTSIPVAAPHAYDLPVKRMTVRQSMKLEGQMTELRGTYVYWFVADGVVTSHDSARMVGILKDLPTGILQRWAYVACFSISRPGDEDRTFGWMSEMIAAAVPTFQTATGPEKSAGL